MDSRVKQLLGILESEMEGACSVEDRIEWGFRNDDLVECTFLGNIMNNHEGKLALG
jgi:hypothetical protein